MADPIATALENGRRHRPVPRVRWACKHVRRNRHTDLLGDLQLTKISPAIAR